MNLSRTALYALGCITLLAVIGVGVWFAQISRPEGTTEGGARDGFFGSLFPFGRETTGGALGGERDTGDLDPVGAVPELRKVSEAPVAGGTYVRAGETLLIRYTERDTGHIYETPVTLSTTVRLTNSTVPAVHDSIWLTASSSLLRFLSDEGEVQNFIANVATSSEDQELYGGFLKDYTRIAVGPKGTLFGVLESSTGALLESLGSTGENVRVVFASPIQSWIPHASNGRYFVAPAPSGRSLGSLYEIKNNSLVRVIEERPGFQALAERDGSLVAVTGGAQNALSLAVYDLSNGGMIEVPVGTVTQKCAWALGRAGELVCAIPRSLPQGMYPDDWLLGLVHTDDDLYRVDTETGKVTRVFNLSESGSGPFDVGEAHLSDDGSYFLFINRLDQTLWSATLTPESP